jgi:hypothetical protein
VTPAALTHAELDELSAFFDANKTEWPESICVILGRLIALYLTLINARKKAGDILKTLRMAMGILPTSERGKQLLAKR